MRLSIAKCVWGARYVRTMLDVNLPSLLAPGNVPAAAARLPLEHLLVTTPADRAVIEAHPAYQALTRLIPCRIEPLQEMAATPDYMGQINQMNLAHRQILADCRARGATWVFDQPDHVWGDGSLDHLATLALRGARCVLFAGIRTNREQMVPILENWRGDATGTGPVMAIGNEPLLRLAIEHMHVHDQIRFWGPRFSTIGAHNVSWRVGSHSFLRRVFFAQPFLLAPPKEAVEPQRSVDLDYVERAYAPEELSTIANSRDFLVVEVSGRYQFREHTPYPLTVPYLAAWTRRWITDRQMDVFSTPIRFQADDTPEHRWQRMERFSGRIEAALRRSHALYEAQTVLAAERPLLAALLGRLLRDDHAHRRLALPEQASFFAPPEPVLAEWLELSGADLRTAVAGRLVAGRVVTRRDWPGPVRLPTLAGGVLDVYPHAGGGVTVGGVHLTPLDLPGGLRLYSPAAILADVEQTLSGECLE
ncbi:hypothetical protein F1643_02665 [Azospirillum sp. INR13]|uniref:hypothetical protein n=1 Tax=Azospirillum sp. INR13 TaxID=2596919 RepID=UPI00189284E5|nr:hypothetical protein [Azospirillum sp. INR13]MBF5093553.1 hypothetical protein [Azospirillum sp. INR13]